MLLSLVLPSRSALKLLQLLKRYTFLDARAFVFKSQVTWRPILLRNCLSVTIELCVLIRHHLSVQCHSICCLNRIITELDYRALHYTSRFLLPYKSLHPWYIYQYQTCFGGTSVANKFVWCCTMVLREGEGVSIAVLPWLIFLRCVACCGGCTVCCWRFSKFARNKTTVLLSSITIFLRAVVEDHINSWECD